MKIRVINDNGRPMEKLMDENSRYLFCGGHRYIGDAIQEEWKQWVPSTPVFLSAPTGSGKNFFISHVMLPSLMKYNRQHAGHPERILVLSNRIALNRQNKLELIRVIDENRGRDGESYETRCWQFTEIGMDQQMRFGPVDICSYQKLLNSDFLDCHYKFVIIDECHFFTQDASFNAYTANILDAIVDHFQTAIRVYMSATLDDVFVPIIKKEESCQVDIMWRIPTPIYHNTVPEMHAWVTDEKDEKQYKYIGTDLPFGELDGSLYITPNMPGTPYFSCRGKRTENFSGFTCAIYDMPADYGYIDDVVSVGGHPLKDGKLDPVLMENIRNGKNKWIIFVESKDSGESMASLLNHEFGENTAAFICSESKYGTRGSKKVFDEIVNTQKFSCRVLISTKVIDNGISIKDKQVANIAIFLFHRVSFLQMLGRLRVEAGQTISLFIPQYEASQIKTMLKKNLRALVERIVLDDLDYMGRKKLYRRLLQSYGDHAGLDMSTQDGSVSNRMAITYLINHSMFLNRVLQKMGIRSNVEFHGNTRDMYFRVLRTIEDKASLSFEDEQVYFLLDGTECPFADASLLEQKLDFTADEELRRKIMYNFLDRTGGNYQYNGNVDLARCFSLLRYQTAVKNLNGARRESRDFLERTGLLNEDLVDERLTDDEKAEWQRLSQKRDRLYETVESYREEFNRGFQKSSCSPVLEAQYSWIGRRPKIESDAGIDMAEISRDDIIELLGNKCCDDDLCDLSTEAHDKMLREKGFKEAMSDPYLEPLGRYIFKIEGEKIKQIKRVNEFLERQKIDFKFQNEKIRSKNGDEEKGKVFWISVKNSRM